MFDTVAAIATPLGEGGVGIIRISGDASLSILKKIFTLKNDNPLTHIKSHHLYLGYIYDPEKKDIILDEALVSYMQGPHSYTGEDVVEINCHGGYLILQIILKLILKEGARLAENGEFTKRAFLNGRLDLAQAEGIIDIIRAKSETGLNFAVNQMEGLLSKEIDELRAALLKVIAYYEASIDFPEDEIEAIEKDEIEQILENNILALQRMNSTFNTGKIHREGLKTVIAGRPNVGKSSLLNALLHEKRAIVTNIPGTTRDIIEEYINLDGITLKLIDTAGIRATEDLVEKIGVEKSIALLDEADLILILVDALEGIKEEDRKIIELIEAKNKKYLLLINKIDLLKEALQEDDPYLNADKSLKISAKAEIGLDALTEKIKDLFLTGQITSKKGNIITKYRHYEAIMRAEKHLNEVLKGLRQDLPEDFLSIDLRGAWEALGEITGDTIKEDILDKIFSEFCIGK